MQQRGTQKKEDYGENSKKAFDYNSFAFSSALIREATRPICCCLAPSRDSKNVQFIQKWLYARAPSLVDNERELVIVRYTQCIFRIRRKLLSAGRLHAGTTLFTGIASILVTSFISINNINTTSPDHTSAGLWWASWSLSLTISIVNSCSAFFKWERKYLMFFNIYNTLEREIWCFLEGVSPYCTYDENGNVVPSTHKDHVRHFLSKLESLNKKLNDSLLDIEEENQKESATSSTPRKHNPSIVLSPLKQQFISGSLYEDHPPAAIPQEVELTEITREHKQRTISNAEGKIIDAI